MHRPLTARPLLRPALPSLRNTTGRAYHRLGMPRTTTTAAAGAGAGPAAGRRDGDGNEAAGADDAGQREGGAAAASQASRAKPRGTSKKDGYAFVGAYLLNMLLGTLYCWSCYLVPLEQALGVGRGLLSAVFSLATICFTAAVAKVGPACYSRLNPAVIGTGAALLGGSGMLVASQALAYASVAPLFVGYALLFGVASGVGYGLSVQISAMAPFGEGLSTGLITSARAAGAFVFAPVIRGLLDAGGVGHAMYSMGGLLLASAVPLWLLLALAGLDEPIANRKRDRSLELTPEEVERDRQLRPAMFTLWGSLGLGVFAGKDLVREQKEGKGRSGAANDYSHRTPRRRPRPLSLFFHHHLSFISPPTFTFLHHHLSFSSTRRGRDNQNKRRLPRRVSPRRPRNVSSTSPTDPRSQV